MDNQTGIAHGNKRVSGENRMLTGLPTDMSLPIGMGSEVSDFIPLIQ
jgi:hypothetical protein